MERGTLKKIAAGVLVPAAFFFLGREIFRNLEQLRSFRWEIRPGLLALSVVVLALVLLWGVVVWRVLLVRVGAVVPFRPLARAWFLANLSRYIPGVVWQFVSLAQLGPSVGLPPATIVTSLLVQMGFLLHSAALVGVYLLPLSLAGKLAPVLPALRWVMPLSLALVHPAAIRAALGLAGRVTRRPTLEWRAGWAGGVALLALAAASWVAYGAAFHLFLLSFVELPLSALPAVIAINAIAWIVGYVVFFAPGGLGFKEAALALLLAGFVPTAVAASLAIVARLWSIAGEVVPALVLLRRGDDGVDG